MQKYFGGAASSLFTFGIKGGLEAGKTFYDALKLVTRLVNIGDAKSLACHPASTTHRQMSAEQQRVEAGLGLGPGPGQQHDGLGGRHAEDHGDLAVGETSPQPQFDQLALADFIARGELDRHLRRQRLRYRARREALLAALAQHLPAATPRGIAAGTFTWVELALPPAAE